ncbi:hypothetical protein SAMN05660964_01045 [Thiothrix caldifontis]|uniref:Uncharacterized protein n=1 Tax=Thiothrix caldifontis TaxID=525918 RepID=A0A1H3Z3P3_9GAMM|nr:hypothetical protein [Thiothrix caldifontis]SEA18297.1 hypothetical protein SAMN05660964_01045 [Thiothrix caldifontis]
MVSVLRLQLCLFVGWIVFQPAMALSEKGTQTLQQANSSVTTEVIDVQDPLTSPSSNDFLPKLLGSHLYLYFLQSDQFITLQGVVESLWAKHMIKKQ